MTPAAVGERLAEIGFAEVAAATCATPGETAAARTWLVIGGNGENVIHAEGPTRALLLSRN